jgi:hypothetical protein
VIRGVANDGRRIPVRDRADERGKAIQRSRGVQMGHVRRGEGGRSQDRGDVQSAPLAEGTAFDVDAGETEHQCRHGFGGAFAKTSSGSQVVDQSALMQPSFRSRSNRRRTKPCVGLQRTLRLRDGASDVPPTAYLRSLWVRAFAA